MHRIPSLFLLAAKPDLSDDLGGKVHRSAVESVPFLDLNSTLQSSAVQLRSDDRGEKEEGAEFKSCDLPERWKPVR